MSIEAARAAKAARAVVIRDLREGRITVAQALSDPSTHVSCHSLWAILNAPTNMGPVSATKVCEDAGITNDRRILAELRPDEKQAIINALPRRAR